MSVIGEQIKKYRIERGITQEQLGKRVGVTTQAVSRWECGGTPDAEILPNLSEVLGVSIDTLFGREEQSFALSLARQLCQMPKEEVYNYAFSICWAIEIGLVGNVSVIDDFMDKFIENSVISDEKKTDYFAKIISDRGIANARISPDLRHFFLMTEPKGDIKSQLSDFESLRNVFSVFADEKLLRIIFYIYSIPNMPVATSLISKNIGLSIQETDECMEILCKNNLATKTVVAAAEGNINSYLFRKESFVIPMLCFADEIVRGNIRPFWGSFERTKPLL